MTKSIVYESNKRMEYNVSNYSKIKEIILKLNSNELLKEKLQFMLLYKSLFSPLND